MTKSNYIGLSNAQTQTKLFKYQKFAKVKFAAALKEQQKILMERINRASSVNDLLDIPVLVSEAPIKKALTEVYTVTGADFADSTMDAIGNQSLKSDSKEIYMQMMKSYVEQNAGQRISLITNTTEKRFKEIVKQQVDIGIQNGYGVDKIARNIEKSIGFSNKYRAIRIAQTEVIGASNAGSFQAAKSVSIPMEKGWLTKGNADVRHSHKDMNGKWVDMNENFRVPIYKNGKNTGETEPMLLPGDIKASAGNVINCHCTIIYRRKIL